jgi:hypothetical protein
MQRPNVSWMTRSDDRILEWYAEHDIIAPPMVVGVNITGLTNQTVRRRCRELEKNGLLNRHPEGQGYYKISDLGRSYLNGTLSVDDLSFHEEMDEIDDEDGDS